MFLFLPSFLVLADHHSCSVLLTHSVGFSAFSLALHWVCSLTEICFPDLLLPIFIDDFIKGAGSPAKQTQSSLQSQKTHLFDAGAAKCLLNSGTSTTDWLKAEYQGWGGDGKHGCRMEREPVWLGSIKSLFLPSGVFQPPQCFFPKVLLIIKWIWASCRELHVFLDLCFSASSQLGLRCQ